MAFEDVTLTGEPVLVSVPLHYAGFLCKVHICLARNLRQLLQELHKHTLSDPYFITLRLALHFHVKYKHGGAGSTLNCCSNPEHLACGTSLCMSAMATLSSWATTAVFPQRR